MAKMTFDGIDRFTHQLSNLSSEVTNINKGALGEGAKYAAEQVGNAVDGLPVCSDHYTVPGAKRYGATENEKAQIRENFGIARFKQSNGGWNTSIGFKGYVDTPSKRFNDHVPTGMLVQCIDQGTDFRKGTHSISKASKSTKGGVEKKIQDYIDKEVNKIMK